MARKVETKHRKNWQGGDSERLMIRLPETLRRVWQAEANAAAGVSRGAPLGPWIRTMVQRARGVAE